MVFKWFQKAAKGIMHSLNPDKPLVRVADDGFMSDDITVTLEDILSSEDRDEYGKAHILSLTEFKAALGKLWEKRKDKIMIITEAVLRNEIGIGNHWENPSPKVYVMLFPSLGETEAAARAYDIAEEIGFKIIGDRFGQGKGPRIRVAGVDLNDIANEDGTINIEKIEEAGEQGIAAGKVGDDDPSKIDAPDLNKKSKSKDKETSEISGDDGSPNWKKNQFDHEESSTDWEKNRFDHEEGSTDWQKNNLDNPDGEDPEWKKNQIEREEGEDSEWVAMKAESETASANPPSIEDNYKATMKFFPCWDRENQALQIYRSTIYVEKNDQFLAYGLEGYGAYRSTTLSLLDKDIWALKETSKALFAHTQKNILTPVFVPVHMTSLIGQNFESFLEIASKLNDKIRSDYVIFEIIAAKGFNLDSLYEAVKTLRELNFKIALSGTVEQLGKIPDQLELNYAGYDFATLEPGVNISTELIENTASALKRRDVQFFVFGISQRWQLAAMLDAGASLVNGPALVKITDKMRPPYPLPEERLRPK